MAKVVTEYERSLEEFGMERQRRGLAWRNRLANLALVGAADDAPGNHPSFAEKKDRYRNSLIGLTHRLAEEGDWDEAALLRRSEELAKRAIRVWPWEHTP